MITCTDSCAPTSPYKHLDPETNEYICLDGCYSTYTNPDNTCVENCPKFRDPFYNELSYTTNFYCKDNCPTSYANGLICKIETTCSTQFTNRSIGTTISCVPECTSELANELLICVISCAPG